MMSRLIVMFLFLLVCMTYSHGSNTSAASAGAGEPKIKCIEAERQALLNIKHHLQGASNASDDPLSSWGNEEERRDCCRWLGIRCSNKSGNVISLDLSTSTFGVSDYAVTLGGMISPSLFELRYLTYLDLSFVGLYGSHIPSSIGTLSRLRYLNLSHTSLLGEIPPQFANLSGLEVLDLGDTDLVTTNILECAPHLSYLRILVLSRTNLSNASDWVEKVNRLSSLKDLQLDMCNLPNIGYPPSLSFSNSSESLAFLDLWGNELSTSIYPWLLNHSHSLVHLDLSQNRLDGSIPEAFGKMVGLTFLDLRNNMLEGSIPEAFSRMVGLTYLNLGFNDLSGTIPELIFENMSALEYLHIGDNILQGQIPPSIWNQSKLHALITGSNNLSGHIPQTAFQRLKQLEIFDVSRNSFGGVISEAGLSNLSRLYYLDLSFNSLALDIRSDWVPPFQLQSILLASCKMGPLFPKWLQTQKNYYELDISSSQISDTIAKWFWDSLAGFTSWDGIRCLNLSNNEIKGEFGNISFKIENNFWDIDLSSNQLEGSVPSFLFKAVALYISRNKFSKLNFRCNVTGPAYLGYLDVSYNKLLEVPDCWSQFQSLGGLMLSDNNLSGKIPSSFGSLTTVRVLQLSNNYFSGALPSTLKNCINLIVFDVGGNKLSGLIPPWVGDSLPKLTILSLRSNHFSGSIPSSICHLSNLQILDLSLNDITGSIPKCIRSFAALTRSTIDYRYYELKEHVIWKGKMSELKSTLFFLGSIDLSSNRLIGDIPREITQLFGLVSLNLSRNSLCGQIPSEIGHLTSLDALDLSWNRLIGEIPQSLADIDRLNALDLSNNNLSGRIPTGTQLQSFPNAYMGNAELCGDPLPKKCLDEEHESTDYGAHEEADALLTRGFYISMALGFILAFWGVCGALILNKSIRYAYFRLLNDVGDWIYVKAAIHKARLLRMIKS